MSGSLQISPLSHESQIEGISDNQSEGGMTLLEMCLNHITLKYLEHCKRYGQVIAQLLGGYHMYAHTHIFSHEILENRKRTLFGLKITPRFGTSSQKFSMERGWSKKGREGGDTPDFLPPLPLELSPWWIHNLWQQLSMPSRAENPASAQRIPLDTWSSSWCIGDPTAVQC